jgi:dTDP-glucose pyrophosphorylase
MQNNVNNLQKALLSSNATLRSALELINQLACNMILVVDSDMKLIGSLSDGDARRALLSGVCLSDSVTSAMNPSPKVANQDSDILLRMNIMRDFGLKFLPIVRDDRMVIGIEFAKETTVQPVRDEWVVIMAGGMGKRLQELTREVPKPMLKVGPRPLLDTIVRSLSIQGFKNLFLAVNYKAEVIESYFGDGSKIGVNIKYLREEKRLGTAGALSLLPSRPSTSFLVTNADLLTNIDFCGLLDSHKASNAGLTICVKDQSVQIPFGVIYENAGSVLKIEEKPTIPLSVNAGIYALSPSSLDLVPPNSFFNMTDLLDSMLEKNLQVRSHKLEGSWLDIGRAVDYEKANEIYEHSAPSLPSAVSGALIGERCS